MKMIATAAALTLASIPGAADAALLRFQVTGDYAATFDLDTAKSPSDSSAQAIGFFDVKGIFGDAGDDGIADVYFFTSASQGGLRLGSILSPAILLDSRGPQIFSGTPEKPMFSPGVFALTERSGGAARYTLTISNAVAAVPELATWAMMLAGFGLVGGTMRRRQKIATRVTFA